MVSGRKRGNGIIFVCSQCWNSAFQFWKAMVGFVSAVQCSLITFVLVHNIGGGLMRTQVPNFVCCIFCLLPHSQSSGTGGGWSPLAEIKAETWNFVSSQAFIPKGRNKGLIPLSPFLHLFYCKWEMALIGAENKNSDSSNIYFQAAQGLVQGSF